MVEKGFQNTVREVAADDVNSGANAAFQAEFQDMSKKSFAETVPTSPMAGSSTDAPTNSPKDGSTTDIPMNSPTAKADSPDYTLMDTGFCAAVIGSYAWLAKDLPHPALKVGAIAGGLGMTYLCKDAITEPLGLTTKK